MGIESELWSANSTGIKEQSVMHPWPKICHERETEGVSRRKLLRSPKSWSIPEVVITGQPQPFYFSNGKFPVWSILIAM